MRLGLYINTLDIFRVREIPRLTFRYLESWEESVELCLLLPRGRRLTAAPTSGCPRRYGNRQAVSINASYITAQDDQEEEIQNSQI